MLCDEGGGDSWILDVVIMIITQLLISSLSFHHRYHQLLLTDLGAEEEKQRDRNPIGEASKSWGKKSEAFVTWGRRVGEK